MITTVRKLGAMFIGALLMAFTTVTPAMGVDQTKVFSVEATWSQNATNVANDTDLSAVAYFSRNTVSGLGDSSGKTTYSVTFSFTNAIIVSPPKQCISGTITYTPDKSGLTCDVTSLEEIGSAQALPLVIRAHGANGAVIKGSVTDGNTSANFKPVTITANNMVDPALFGIANSSDNGSGVWANNFQALVYQPFGSEPLDPNAGAELTLTVQNTTPNSNVVPQLSILGDVPAVPGGAILTQIAPGQYKLVIPKLAVQGQPSPDPDVHDRYLYGGTQLELRWTSSGYQSYTVSVTGVKVTTSSETTVTTDQNLANNEHQATSVSGGTFNAHWSVSSNTPWAAPDNRFTDTLYTQAGDGIQVGFFTQQIRTGALNQLMSQGQWFIGSLYDQPSRVAADTGYLFSYAGGDMSTVDRSTLEGRRAMTLSMLDLYNKQGVRFWGLTTDQTLGIDPLAIPTIETAINTGSWVELTKDNIFTTTVHGVLMTGPQNGPRPSEATDVKTFGFYITPVSTAGNLLMRAAGFAGNWTTAPFTGAHVIYSANPTPIFTYDDQIHTTGTYDAIMTPRLRAGTVVNVTTDKAPTLGSTQIWDVAYLADGGQGLSTAGTLSVNVPANQKVDVSSFTIAPTSTTVQSDGSTTYQWVNLDVLANYTAKHMTFTTTALAGDQQRSVESTFTLTGPLSDPAFSLNTAQGSKSFALYNVNETEIYKSVDSPTTVINDANTWTIEYRNSSLNPQGIVDIIDVLPYNGDDRGTSFSGTMSITTITPPPNTTIYYSSAPSSTLSKDPADASNGNIGAPSSLWSTTKPSTVTAVRFISTNIAPLSSSYYRIGFTTFGNNGSDHYANTAVARSSGTRLLTQRGVTTTVLDNRPPLTIKKKLISGVYAPGRTITFTVTVSNETDQPYTNAIIDEKPSAPLDTWSYTWENVSQGQTDGLVWNIGQIDPHTSHEATIAFTVPDIDPLPSLGGAVNTACVRVQDTCVSTPFIDLSRLQIDKRLIDPIHHVPGQPVRYEITVKNNATPQDGAMSTAGDVSVHDLAGLGLDPATVSWSNPSQGNTAGAQWNLGDLEGGKSATAVVRAELSDDMLSGVVNGAVVSSPAHPMSMMNPTDGNINDGVDADNDQKDWVRVEPEDSRLVIEKTLLTQGLNTDGLLEYVVTVRNTGTQTAAQVQASDLKGQGIDAVSFTQPSRGNVDGGIWTIGDLEPGVNVTAHVFATPSKVGGGQTYVNSASVSNPTHPYSVQTCVDEDLLSDTDQCDTVAVTPKTTLAINKTLVSHTLDNNGLWHLGYDIEVANTSEYNEPRVIVNDLGGDHLSLDTSQWSQLSAGSAQGGQWLVGYLGPQQKATGHIDIVTDKPLTDGTPLVNTATVEGDFTTVNPNPDTCIPNDSVTDDTDQCDKETFTPRTELVIDKELLSKNGRENGKLTYRITVKNTGLHPASGTTVREYVDNNLSHPVFDTVSVGTVDNGQWVVGLLQPGQQESAVVIANMNDESASAINKATVGSHQLDEGDAKTCKDDGSLDTDTDRCDYAPYAEDSHLVIDKSFTTVSAGEVTYTVKVANTGHDTATGVVVRDMPDTDLNKVTLLDPSTGTIDGLTWRVGTLKPGQAETLTVKATLINPHVETVNEARVSSPAHPLTHGVCVEDGSLVKDSDQCDSAIRAGDPIALAEPEPMPQTGLSGAGLLGAAVGLIVGGLLFMSPRLRENKARRG